MDQTRTTALPAGILSESRRLIWAGGFALLTAAGAQITIPQQPVPFTLQTFFVLLAGALLGMRTGAMSQAIYLLAGLCGLPVFAGFGFGLARLIGPTGGYLLAFPLAAFAVGYLAGERAGFIRYLLAMTAGLLIIFTIGTLQLNLTLYHNLSAAAAHGFMIFSVWDGVKLAGAAAIAASFRGRLRG